MSDIVTNYNWQDGTDRFTAGDMNRINNNIKAIQEALCLLEHAGSLPEASGLYEAKTISYLSDFEQPEINLHYLSQEYFVPIGWEIPQRDWKDKPYLTAADLNRIEYNTHIFKEHIENMKQELRYSGTFSCGDNMTLM